MTQRFTTTRRAAKAIFASIVASVLGAVGVAPASPNYPDLVQEVSDADCVPSCLLCHSTNPGRSGTAANSMKAFVVSAIGRGLGPGLDDDAARAAFVKMRDGVDSNMDGTIDMPPTDGNMDGTSDFADLAAGVDPSDGGELCEITYGCGARVAPPPPSNGLALFTAALTALGLAGIGWRARRRRR